MKESTLAEIDAALKAADACFDELRSKTPEQRASFLDAIATEIEGIGDVLLETAHKETALPLARLTAERGRVTMQARMFASLLREGSWLESRIDSGIPDRKPAPKPDIRRMMLPIGPVVVFGASNFPLAISIAGTDSVSAMAAGCPVVAKAHPAHQQTCELVATAVARAAESTGMPKAAFSMVSGASQEVGMALVKHPLTGVVAFTGSLKGGRALYDAAVSRPNPIPFYGELGSVNPVFLLPGALEQRAAEMADDFMTSMTMGVGQYCTNPGLIFSVKSPALDAWKQEMASRIQSAAPATMLHQGINAAFHEGVARLKQSKGVRVIADANGLQSEQAAPALFETELSNFESSRELSEEIFGPVSLLSVAGTTHDLERVAESLEGQLTASIHGTAEDLRQHARLIRILERKVGRIIFNGFGTGIEVCPSMHHGGPYPATTHPFYTSIGSAAIYRFVRPVCYQGFPDDCLPEPLKNENITGAWRLVNNELTQASLDGQG